MRACQVSLILTLVYQHKEGKEGREADKKTNWIRSTCTVNRQI